MIVTRTPFRVTLGGGGTDLPSYYSKRGGFVLSMAITRYMYVMVNPREIDQKIVLHYRQSEVVDSVDDLRHDLVREALRHLGIRQAIEISSMADLPAGTGVGSSGSFLVGLLLALHQLTRDYVTLQALAEEACAIELDVLRKPIGKQDQFIAAFGGLTALDIARDGTVHPRSLVLGDSALANLVANTHIYYTGHHRDATEALAPQNQAMLDGSDERHAVVAESLDGIMDLGMRIEEAIRDEQFDVWGQLLHEHWTFKKRLSPDVSLTSVDSMYDETRSRFGVLGGKIIGAGGGGFLMLYCPAQHKALEQFMTSHGMPRLHYMVEPEGVKVMADMAAGRRPSRGPAR
jgi:D-glycero-alpha-D-manno-heptose-7-phosphate kinase